jgi:hypothetical protein
MRRLAFLLFFTVLIRPCAHPANRNARAARRSEARDQASAQRKPSIATSVQRSSAARRQFQREHPCPATGMTTGSCPGYVVDHIVPLKRGGADSPENMQWQTVAEAKAKDKIE